MVRPAVVALFLVGTLAGCYDVPRPVCGFFCGPDSACPGDYSCQRGRCILNSALSTLDLDNLGASCELGGAGFVPDDARGQGPIDMPAGPRVVDHVPVDLAANVPIGSTITVTFSEPVTQVTTNTVSVFELQAGTFDSVGVLGTITQPTPTTAMFTPAEPLAMGAGYSVFLSPSIVDLDGYPLPFTQWSFKTEPDTVPPAIVSRTPAPGTTGVPLDANVTVQLDERVNGIGNATFELGRDGVGVGGRVSYDDQTRTATLDPFSPLEPDTTYEVTLSGAIVDRGNNPIPGAPIMWSFTTAP